MSTALFATFAALFATTPNLCDEVYVDADGSPYTDAIGQTVSRYCQPTGPDAPVWDADVCCVVDGDTAVCVTPDVDGHCANGDRYYCKYADVDSANGVTCYQPFPSACEFGFCVELPGVLPPAQEGAVCCNEWGVCQVLTPEGLDTCDETGGIVLWCGFGMTNEDGTVDCFD